MQPFQRDSNTSGPTILAFRALPATAITKPRLQLPIRQISLINLNLDLSLQVYNPAILIHVPSRMLLVQVLEGLGLEWYRCPQLNMTPPKHNMVIAEPMLRLLLHCIRIAEIEIGFVCVVYFPDSALNMFNFHSPRRRSVPSTYQYCPYCAAQRPNGHQASSQTLNQYR